MLMLKVTCNGPSVAFATESALRVRFRTDRSIRLPGRRLGKVRKTRAYQVLGRPLHRKRPLSNKKVSGAAASQITELLCESVSLSSLVSSTEHDPQASLVARPDDQIQRGPTRPEQVASNDAAPRPPQVDMEENGWRIPNSVACEL